MKRTIILITLLLASLIYFNCKSSTTGPSNSGNNTLTPIQTVSGKVQSWSLGSKTLKVFSYNNIILTSTGIDSSGNFTVNFPNIVLDNSLTRPSFFNDTNCNHQITVKPSDLKCTYSNFTVFDDSNMIGYLSKESGTLPNTGYTELRYYYYNDSGSIAGTGTCNYSGLIENETFALNFPKGWYNETFIIDIDTNGYFRYHVNNTQPSVLTWNFHSTNNKKNTGRYLK